MSPVLRRRALPRAGLVVAGCALLLVSACGPRIDMAAALRAQGGSAGLGGATADPSDEGAAAGAAEGSAGDAGTGEAGTGRGGTGGTSSRSSTGRGPAVDNGGATDAGVTATRILVGASAAVEGPLPGQFVPAVHGIGAYFRLVNEQGGVFGRDVAFHYHDDAMNRDKYRDNTVHLANEDKVFAFTGGMSASDDGGCKRFEDVPDVGTFALTYCRAQAPNFSSPMGSLKQGIYGGTAEWAWLRDRFGIAKPGVEYLSTIEVSQDQGLAVADGLVRVLKLRGRSDVYRGGQNPANPDYNAEVLRLSGQGVDSVFTSMDLPSNVRLLRAMCQQGYRPKVVHFEISSYDPALLSQVDEACLGSQNLFIRTPHLPFDRTDNAEMRLYLSTLKRFYPAASPTTFGLEGWLSGKLFVEALRAAGPRITRAKLFSALDVIADWTGGGLIGPNTPSKRLIYHCNVMLKVEPTGFEARTGFLCGKFYKSETYDQPPVGP